MSANHTNYGQSFKRKQFPRNQRYNYHTSLDQFIQASLDSFNYEEFPEELITVDKKVKEILISDSCETPDLVIYNTTFNKNLCFVDSGSSNGYQSFPRTKFTVKVKNVKLKYKDSEKFEDEDYYDGEEEDPQWTDINVKEINQNLEFKALPKAIGEQKVEEDKVEVDDGLQIKPMDSKNSLGSTECEKLEELKLMMTKTESEKYESVSSFLEANNLNTKNIEKEKFVPTDLIKQLESFFQKPANADESAFSGFNNFNAFNFSNAFIPVSENKKENPHSGINLISNLNLEQPSQKSLANIKMEEEHNNSNEFKGLTLNSNPENDHNLTHSDDENPRSRLHSLRFDEEEENNQENNEYSKNGFSVSNLIEKTKPLLGKLEKSNSSSKNLIKASLKNEDSGSKLINISTSAPQSSSGTSKPIMTEDFQTFYNKLKELSLIHEHGNLREDNATYQKEKVKGFNVFNEFGNAFTKNENSKGPIKEEDFKKAFNDNFLSSMKQNSNNVFAQPSWSQQESFKMGLDFGQKQPTPDSFNKFDRQDRFDMQGQGNRFDDSQIKYSENDEKDYFRDPVQVIIKNLTSNGWRVEDSKLGLRKQFNSYSLLEYFNCMKDMGRDLSDFNLIEVETDIYFNPHIIFDQLLETIPKIFEFENMRFSAFNQGIQNMVNSPSRRRNYVEIREPQLTSYPEGFKETKNINNSMMPPFNDAFGDFQGERNGLRNEDNRDSRDIRDFRDNRDRRGQMNEVYSDFYRNKFSNVGGKVYPPFVAPNPPYNPLMRGGVQTNSHPTQSFNNLRGYTPNVNMMPFQQQEFQHPNQYINVPPFNRKVMPSQAYSSQMPVRNSQFYHSNMKMGAGFPFYMPPNEEQCFDDSFNNDFIINRVNLNSKMEHFQNTNNRAKPGYPTMGKYN